MFKQTPYPFTLQQMWAKPNSNLTIQWNANQDASNQLLESSATVTIT